MTPKITDWQPAEVAAIQQHLGRFHNWCLCGGKSLDWLLGRTTREHGDTDIGVFRSDLISCLKQIGAQRVYLCQPPGSFTPWDGSEVPASVHDIWVTDPPGRHWVLQIMVYDDLDDEVVYRRDPRIRWPKAKHAILVRGISIVNPVVALLFKLNKAKLETKDGQDLRTLIEELGQTSMMPGDAGYGQTDPVQGTIGGQR
jgi:hypothetical protein